MQTFLTVFGRTRIVGKLRGQQCYEMKHECWNWQTGSTKGTMFYTSVWTNIIFITLNPERQYRRSLKYIEIILFY